MRGADFREDLGTDWPHAGTPSSSRSTVCMETGWRQWEQAFRRAGFFLHSVAEATAGVIVSARGGEGGRHAGHVAGPAPAPPDGI